MSVRARVDAETARRNMAEIEPRYSPQEAMLEAERCLYCFDAPCIQSCPTGIDVPAFIKKIAAGNLVGSARTILQANVLGASCARACPTQVLCEGACVLLDRDRNPIKIGRLQRYATDHVFDNGISVLQGGEVRSGRRVALVGAGPASLGCAAELARLGHDAVIYEKKPLAGGLNTYGIAYYKMKPEVSLAEVELVRSLGVEIREGVEVGVQVSWQQLRDDYDAVFVGTGLGKTHRLGIAGEELPEVVDALTFIEGIRTQPLHEVAVGARVVVIGCGNTAIDAATQAKRLGAASAVIVYRRGEEEMSAYDFEYALAKSDGAEFMFHQQPIAILGAEHVTGVRMAQTRIDSHGNCAVLPGTECEVPADMVIKALGQDKMRDLYQSWSLDTDARGAIVRDFESGATSLSGVFAGGDAANGGSEVVDAVAEGKRAARGIHELFASTTVDGPVQTSRLGSSKPTGSGFDRPLRVAALEQAYFQATAASAAPAKTPKAAGKKKHG